MSVIFLAGVHGVGKSHISAPVAQAFGFSHFTASQLIREERGIATWGNDKRTFGLGDNQLALIRAVGKKRLIHKDILLDGHFALQDAQGRIALLETEVFKGLHLTGVILLTDEVHVIAGRLEIRDKGVIGIDVISELAKAESSHAQDVCCDLGLVLEVIHAPTETSIGDAIKRLVKADAATR